MGLYFRNGSKAARRIGEFCCRVAVRTHASYPPYAPCEPPKAGDVMEGTGGVRKLRWRRGGQGKSGGVRVIYYYHDDLMPLYLLTLFAKGDKAERNDLASLVDVLVEIWRGKTP